MGNRAGTPGVRLERRFMARDGRWVELRPASADDAGPLLDALNEVAAEGRYLLRRHWEITPDLRERWLRVAASPQDLLLVATVAEAETETPEVVGSLSLVRGRPEFIQHTAELGMWLRAAYREIGIGSALVEVALDWAAAHTIEKLYLSVRGGNRRALALYMKYGFVEEGRRRAFIKTPHGYEDECLLSRFVSPPDSVLSALESDPDSVPLAPPANRR